MCMLLFNLLLILDISHSYPNWSEGVIFFEIKYNKWDLHYFLYVV